MLHIISDIKHLSYSGCMAVYEESNQRDASILYDYLDKSVALHYAQQDLYTYLETVFFRENDSFIALWIENHAYVSALRLEPFLDGVLVTALETAPNRRNRGYATALLQAVVAHIKHAEGVPVYSHVNKSNVASMACHLKSGFRIHKDDAVFIDGSLHTECVTMQCL